MPKKIDDPSTALLATLQRIATALELANTYNAKAALINDWNLKMIQGQQGGILQATVLPTPK